MGKDKNEGKDKKEDKKPCDTCQGTGAYYSEVLDVIISCPWCDGHGKR